MECGVVHQWIIVISFESSQSVRSDLMQQISNMETLTTKATRCTCGSQFRTKPEQKAITCYTDSGTITLLHATKRCPQKGCQKGTWAIILQLFFRFGQLDTGELWTRRAMKIGGPSIRHHCDHWNCKIFLDWTYPI